MKFKRGDRVKLSVQALSFAKTDKQKLDWPKQQGQIRSIEPFRSSNNGLMTLIKVSFPDPYLKSISFTPEYLKLVKD